MIQKDLLLKYGATAHFHGVSNVQGAYPFDSLVVTVQSYASQDAFIAKSGLMWSEDIVVPTATMGSVPVLDFIENWLVTSPSSPLFSGFIVPDESETLEAVQARQWIAIKAARAKAKVGNFVYDGGTYYADDTEVPNSALRAFISKSLNLPYSETWTLTDNTTRELNADQVIALGMAYGDYVSGAYATARQLRNEIFKEDATIESVLAVKWPSANIGGL